ncbi:MAG: PDZ domain-containing protein [Planctomycetota bacterium]
MKPSRLILALLCSAFLHATPQAQDATPEPRAEVQKSADIDRLIEQMGAERAADRRAAENSLREIGEKARAALEKAADDSEDPEIRWRARRLLRGLDGAAPRLERRGTDREGPAPAQEQDKDKDKDVDPLRQGNDVDAHIKEMMKRMEESFGPDFRGLRDFGDLQKQMEDLQRRMEEMQGRTFGGRFGAQPFSGMKGFSNGTKVQVGPDGVHVEVQEQKSDGGTETKSYDAPDMDSFRSQYPEIAKRIFGDGGMQFFPRTFGRLQPQQPRGFGGTDPFIVPAPAEVAPPAEGEKLGVYLGALDDSVRRFLEIEDGLGIVVDRIEDGSLAATLGLRPKDVILRIGDHEVRDASDVRAALRGIKKGETVVVEINRHGEVRKLEAAKDADAPAPRKLERVKQKPAKDGDDEGKGGSSHR